MSAAKSTLSDDVRHRMLPPWGLYFFKFSAPFPHHPHFCDHVNHYDAMPAQWDCPIDGRGMRAKRCGRGYPEGVIRSTGQG